MMTYEKHEMEIEIFTEEDIFFVVTASVEFGTGDPTGFK